MQAINSIVGYCPATSSFVLLMYIDYCDTAVKTIGDLGDPLRSPLG